MSPPLGDCFRQRARGSSVTSLRAMTSRRVEGTATSLIVPTDCIYVLVNDFDRLRATICRWESSITSLRVMTSRHVDMTSRRVEGAVTSLVAPTYRHLFEGEVLSKKVSSWLENWLSPDCQKSAESGGIRYRRLEAVPRWDNYLRRANSFRRFTDMSNYRRGHTVVARQLSGFRRRTRIYG